jgi:adenylate cyclase
LVGDCETEIEIADRAVTLNPNSHRAWNCRGWVYKVAGQPEEAIDLIKQAMRLNPRYPYNYLANLGMAYGLARRYEDALATLQTATLRNPNFPPSHLHLLVSYSELGRDAEARAELAELLRLMPNLSLERHRQIMPFKNPADLEHLLDALRKAGLK